MGLCAASERASVIFSQCVFLQVGGGVLYTTHRGPSLYDASYTHSVYSDREGCGCVCVHYIYILLPVRHATCAASVRSYTGTRSLARWLTARHNTELLGHRLRPTGAGQFFTGMYGGKPPSPLQSVACTEVGTIPQYRQHLGYALDSCTSSSPAKVR